MRDIEQTLADMTANAEWQRVNPDNPICNGCNRRTNALQMILVDSVLMCAECADDKLESDTGCRFGEANCLHPDCIA